MGSDAPSKQRSGIFIPQPLALFLLALVSFLVLLNLEPRGGVYYEADGGVSENSEWRREDLESVANRQLLFAGWTTEQAKRNILQ